MDFQTAFKEGFTRLHGHEGGYVNHPDDPGGETKFGISKRTYPEVDIKNLSINEAMFLYKRDFWDKIHGDKLHDGVAFQLFDFAVNSGCQTAIRYFQRAIGVADDGHWGKVSQAAADAMSESDQIMRLVAERQEFQTKLSTWATFGKGLARRNAANLRYGAIDS